MTPLETFKAHIFEMQDLHGASSVLGWDQQVNMPPGGAIARANQIATLSRLIHEKLTSSTTERLLGELEAQDLEYDSDDASLMRLVRREFDRARKLPSDFVAERKRAMSVSEGVWAQAKANNDFKSFLPHLETMFDLARRQAEYLGYSEHPYDALLDDYEPDLRASEVETVFQELRDQTVPLVRAIVQKGESTDYSVLEREFGEDTQRDFALKVSQAFGYDLTRGRLDRAVHPFETTFSRDDVRITTRYDQHFLPMALFGVLHETGHALYEQNTAPELYRTPLARGTSSGVHESQSRMWENLVGRSKAFWTHWFPQLQLAFPNLQDVTLEHFYRAINRVRPSLIRVEADEITYNLHIMLRFELEKAALTGEIQPRDLPEAWNAKMQAYLGITPPDDAQGVLQDIHWSAGYIGYFPTYTLGNIMSVQLFDAAKRELGDLEADFARGEYGRLLGWMGEHVHRHGKKFKPQELLERATGSRLTAKPYVAYLKQKFGALYGLG